MKKRSVFYCLAALSMLAAMPLTAQDNDEETTIEDIYLQTSLKTQIIKTEAESPAREIKLIALRDIQEMIESGLANESSVEVIQILDNLAKEGVDNSVYENGVLINNYTEVRRQACRTLGEIGGKHARDSLLTIMLNENEPMVMSEAVIALSKVGDNQTGEVVKTIGKAMKSQTAYNKDNNFAYASLIALEKIAEDNQGIEDQDIFQAVAAMVDPRTGYIKEVRDRAAELLKKLQLYKKK